MSTSIGRILLMATCAASSVFAEETMLFQQDFEGQTPGLKPEGWLRHTFGKDVPDRFDVSSEESVSGDNSLKFARTDYAVGWQAEMRAGRIPPNASGRLELSFHILIQGQPASSPHRMIFRRTGTEELLIVWLRSDKVSIGYTPEKKRLEFPRITVAPNRWYRVAFSIPLTPRDGTTLRAELTDLTENKTQEVETEWASFSPPPTDERYQFLWDFWGGMRQTNIFLDDVRFSVVKTTTPKS